MIRAGVRRVISMICGQNQQILLAQQRQQLAQFLVKPFYFLCIANGIAPMSPQRVKIHKIDKAQTCEVALRHRNGLLHTVHGAFGLLRLGDAFSNENIIDFSNGNHIKSGVFQDIERRASGRFDGIIVPIACAYKFTALFADIWPRNDTSDFPLVTHRDFSCNLTAAIQLLQIKGLLIAADLQHRIRRGIHNHMPCGNFFLAQLVQNDRAARALVANALVPCLSFQLCNQLRWKTGVRKCPKRNRRA